VSYVVGQIAGILIGLVMLRSDRFGRAIPYTLMVGNVVGFGLYLPTVGRAISAFSGLVLWAWYLLIARRFFQLDGAIRSLESTDDRAGQPTDLAIVR
jgi:hypothetical protein